MAVNKVEINGVVKLDLTADTVTAAKLAQGETAHDASGELIIGTMTAPQLHIVVTTSAGATVTATKGSKKVSGTADASGNCTLTVDEAGTWSVVATLGATTKQQDVVVGTSSVVIEFVSAVLNDNAWETIRSVSDRGEGANYWSIGDRKAVTLNGTVGHLSLSNYTTYAFIIGFNHNASVEGSNRIHFQLAKTALSGGKDVSFCDSKYNANVSATGYFSMNSSKTNSGGYKNLRDEPLELFRDDYCGHPGSTPFRPQVRYQVHGQHRRRKYGGERSHGDNGLLFPPLGVRGFQKHFRRK